MSLLYAQKGKLGSTDGGVTTPDQFASEGAIYTGRKPCMVWFRGDLYVVGYYTRPVVRHSQTGGRWFLAGISPPKVKLAVVPGASAGGSSGGCLAAITFLHKAGGSVLAESNFSNVVNVGNLTGQGRAWSNIDHTTGEKRVTHVRGYVSMVGGDFRMAWEAPYGLSAINENVRTAQLVFVGPQDYDHKVPPSTKFGHIAFGRMWYANSTRFPYRLWYSLPGQPQYTKDVGFRDTTDREPITALWKGRNELLVWGIRSAYMVRQFGNGLDDFVLEKLDTDVGNLSQFATQEIHNRVWFPGEDGAWIYDGGFKYLMKEMVPLWKDDFKTNKQAFLDSFAMHDRINKCYILVTQRPTRPEFEKTGLKPGSVEYVGYYGAFDPSLAGSQEHPDWLLDMKDRFDSAGFYNEDGELVIGSCDGKIRKQTLEDGTDDADLLQKTAIIRTGHQLFFEPGDELEFNKRLEQLWAYVESEESSWTMHIKGGDEQAWKGQLPDANFWYWSDVVPASVKTETRTITGRDLTIRTYSVQYAPETVHTFTPEKVTGSGFTFEVRAVAPKKLYYRGIGGAWGPGADQRGNELVTNYDLVVLANENGDPVAAMDPRHTLTIPGSGTNLVDFSVNVTAYKYGTPAVPITVTIAATGIGGWSASGPVNPLGTPFTHQQAIASGNDWTVTVTAVDSNGIPANPVYTFRVLRP